MVSFAAVGLVRCPGVKVPVRPFAVLEIQIPAQRCPRLRDRDVGPRIDLLVLDGSPETLDEDVVASGPTAIHADRDLVVQQQTGERDDGERAALVGVAYVGAFHAAPDRDSIAELRCHRPV
jgi:hypothetical protein